MERGERFMGRCGSGCFRPVAGNGSPELDALKVTFDMAQRQNM